jgi:hypothetical protein
MWNDIVKANCARANTTASQPSNISTTCRSFVGRDLEKTELEFSKIASEPGVYLTTPDATIIPARQAEQACRSSRQAMDSVPVAG